MFFYSKFVPNYKVNYNKSKLIQYFFIEITRICCMHFIRPAYSLRMKMTKMTKEDHALLHQKKH